MAYEALHAIKETKPNQTNPFLFQFLKIPIHNILSHLRILSMTFGQNT